LLEHGDLTEQEAIDVLQALADVDTPPALGGALLAALRAKGVVAD
jgi:anthranilate phosphoribosyltransferase